MSRWPQSPLDPAERELARRLAQLDPRRAVAADRCRDPGCRRRRHRRRHRRATVALAPAVTPLAGGPGHRGLLAALGRPGSCVRCPTPRWSGCRDRLPLARHRQPRAAPASIHAGDRPARRRTGPGRRRRACCPHHASPGEPHRRSTRVRTRPAPPTPAGTPTQPGRRWRRRRPGSGRAVADASSVRRAAAGRGRAAGGAARAGPPLSRSRGLRARPASHRAPAPPQSSTRRGRSFPSAPAQAAPALAAPRLRWRHQPWRPPGRAPADRSGRRPPPTTSRRPGRSPDVREAWLQRIRELRDDGRWTRR